MAKTKTGSAHGTPAKSRFPLTIGSMIAIVLIVPVGWMTFNLYRSWSASNAQWYKLTNEQQTLTARNASLGPVYDVLQNKKFQVCNKSAVPVKISWVGVAYSDGKQLRTFDSSRCKAWQTQDVEAGENKNLLLSTNEEGCNWGGNVVYFGMRFSKEAEDSSTPFNYVGLWRGFDRDCFTIP